MKRRKSTKPTKPKAARPTASTRTDRQSWIRGVNDADLKRELDAQARSNPPAAAPARGGTRRAAGAGFIFMRPVCDDYDCPTDPYPDDDRPPRDPCAGQTWVWQPDIAVQINTGSDECPSAADLTRIEHGVGGNLSQFRLPDPEVRVRCVAGKIFIHIWGNRVQSGSCSDQARQRAVIPDLVAGGNFGLFLNSSLIRRVANQVFQESPKTLSTNGAPSPFGPIHLTALSVGFKSPNTIETYVTGYDDRPWPDAYFTQTLRDELLSLRRSNPTESTDVSVSSQIFGLILLGALTYGIPLLLPLTGFVLFGDIDAIVNSADGAGQGGVGARLLQSLPAEIALPESGGTAPPIAMMARRVKLSRLSPGDSGIHPVRKKLVIAYSQPTVDDRGLFIGALTSRQDRVPAVHVGGPANLSFVSTAAQTFGNYVAYAEDFFGKLTYSWSAGANTIIHNPGQLLTKISFKRGTAQPGDLVHRKVSVRVTDPEGSSVVASRDVTLLVNESGDLPPICQIKPWLPQCNP